MTRFACVRRWLPIAFVSVTAWGCAGSLPDIRLEGAPQDIRALVGEWAGEYAGEGGDRRRGNILFRLAEGDDHAHGDVLMTSFSPSQVFGLGSRPDAFGRWDDDHERSEFLSIHFVRVDRERVSGALDPYWDPERGCWAMTVFEGRLTDNAMIGRYQTMFSLPLRNASGTWNVARRVR
jgi:hypothetical protein